MKKLDIHKEIKNAGLMVSLDGDRVRIENPERLTDTMKGLIINHHSLIVRSLFKGAHKNNSKLGELIERRKVERITYITTAKRLNTPFLGV